MSHLRFMKELNNLTRMDDSIKGPPPRWQKKCLENSNSSVNLSLNSSRKGMSSSISNNGKSPLKKKEGKIRKTPKSSRKSPGHTPAKTPNGGDRFIPSRSTTNFDISHYKILQQRNTDQDNDKTEDISPTKREMQRLIGENLYGGDIQNMRVLSYHIKAPAAPDGYQNPLKVLYSQTKTPASVKASTRYIPQAPDRILDAPEIIDDYYLNLVDWSNSNILAVALGANVYLWNAATGSIQQLFELEANDYVCSVSWIQEGPHLAVGTTVGNTELWDCSEMKRVRVMNGHSARVGSLSWNSHILSSGCSSVVEWESEIGPTGEVFYVESAEESLFEDPTVFNNKNDSPQPELTRRRSTRAGKLFRLIRRKESKRWSTRNKKINSSTVASNIGAQEKDANGSKEVTFRDFQAGEIREVILWIDPERRHKLGRRATLCEAYFGITPGVFSDKIRIMVAGFIPDGEAMKNKNIKIGDWLRSINSNNVTWQNLDQILSEIITPSSVTLELQRVAGVDVTAKLPRINEPKQSTLVQYLVNRENNNVYMESLLHYPLGVLYLKTADLSEMGQELQGVLYTFPRSETKNMYSSLCTARGAFITLNHLLPSITGPQPVSTTVHIGEEEMHVVYTSHEDELLLIALPEKWCTLQEAVKITENVVETLEFTYQSLTKCFTTPENQSSLDHFFILIMHRLVNIKDSCIDADAKKHTVEPQNTVESTENYKFRSAFSVANFIQLPRDAQIQIDAALSEMEAMDYRDWNEDPMDCQRLYTILGSCVYHKCYLLGSHLPHEDLIDVHSFLRHNGLLNLMNQEQVKCLVLWKQIYPSSCNRGNSNDNEQLLIPDGKWFLLVVAYGHDLLAVLLESGGCTAKYSDAIGPDVFYVEEAQETLKHVQKIGVTTLASKWIVSNTRPEVIPYEEHTTTKPSSSITENLFGLIKSSDAQTAASKPNINPAINKKSQELPSILKKRSLEESPMISGSVYSLQTSEDSLSQGTGGISEMSDEAMPILGRRATREKINSASRYSDDSDDSDIDIYKNDSHVLALDISNIRENLLNQAEYLIPKKLTAGDKNYLYHYVHLDMVEGILLSSIPIQNTPKDNKILANFNKCVHVIHRLLHNTVRFKKMLNQDMDKTVINRSLIAVKEHGVLFEWDNTAFWVIGRLYTSPHPKELYVCHQDSAPQNLIEIAFQLHI